MASSMLCDKDECVDGFYVAAIFKILYFLIATFLTKKVQIAILCVFCLMHCSLEEYIKAWFAKEAK